MSRLANYVFIAASSEEFELWLQLYNHVLWSVEHSLLFLFMPVSEDRTLWGWGENSYGQLGLSTLEPVYSPQRVLGVRDVAAVSAGWAHSLIITSNFSLLVSSVLVFPVQVW